VSTNVLLRPRHNLPGFSTYAFDRNLPRETIYGLEAPAEATCPNPQPIIIHERFQNWGTKTQPSRSGLLTTTSRTVGKVLYFGRRDLAQDCRHLCRCATRRGLGVWSLGRLVVHAIPYSVLLDEQVDPKKNGVAAQRPPERRALLWHRWKVPGLVPLEMPRPKCICCRLCTRFRSRSRNVAGRMK
jgi:hypothetical protein